MLERSPRMRDIKVRSHADSRAVGLAIGSRVKTGSDSSREQVQVSRVLGEDYYKGMTRVTVRSTL